MMFFTPWTKHQSFRYYCSSCFSILQNALKPEWVLLWRKVLRILDFSKVSRQGALDFVSQYVKGKKEGGLTHTLRQTSDAFIHMWSACWDVRETWTCDFSEWQEIQSCLLRCPPTCSLQTACMHLKVIVSYRAEIMVHKHSSHSQGYRE